MPRRSPRSDAASLIRHATLDAARSLGLEREIGSLEPGKRADLCAVSLEGLHHGPAAEPHAAIALAARPADVTLTMVDGRVLWDGESSALDDRALTERAAAAGRRIRRARSR